MNARLPLGGLVSAIFIFASCSSSDDEFADPRASSGGSGSDGTAASGGANTGGAVPASGGAASSGGAPGSGGGNASGGVTASGGQSSTGGSASASGGTPASGGAPSTGGTSPEGGTWWKPGVNTSWQWQLSGTLDTSFDVQVYDIDMEGTSAATIQSLHGQGRKVVCYFDTAYEPYRDDSKALEPYRGNPMDGWPGQYWLDIRAPEVVAVMNARIEKAAQKGCDGVEADDVDSRSNDPGFPITQAQQRDFVRALAEKSHSVGLAFGLKNDLEDVKSLVDVSDFAVNEECFQYSECDALKPFTQAGKPVFQVEYTDGNLQTKGSQICPEANQLDFNTLIKHLDLDAPRYACR